jgi:putative membrane protein
VYAVANYLIHLVLAAVLLAVFFRAYTWMTP